jgi:hypothetical protein
MAQGETGCEVCGLVPTYPDGFVVTIENSDSDEMWKHFCTWNHLSEWVSRGEPEFDRPPKETLGDKAIRFGCLLIATLLLALVVVGAVAVVRTFL